MFTKLELINLKTSFRAAYPDYCSQLDACTTELELQETYEKIKEDVFAKAEPFLAAGDNPQGFPPMAVDMEQYTMLKTASGQAIKVHVTAMLHLAQIIQPEFSVGRTVATLLGGGITAIGTVAGAAFGKGIVGGMVKAAAVAAGVSAVTVAGLVTLIAVVIVAVIIPILYFMLKPACCFVVIINETSHRLSWKDDFNVSGKPVGYTPNINAPLSLSEDEYFFYIGFVQTVKRDYALHGTQYGFTYTGANNSYNVNFGVECPLTGIYVGNNCYCAIGSTSQHVARTTTRRNVLSFSAKSEVPKLETSIKCNSASGEVAYYIARVEDGSLNN